MRFVWLGLGVLAALSACAPYPGTYGDGYGYSYASPPVADGYYGGEYYGGGGYAAPYYAPVTVPNTVILGGGDRRWDGDRGRYDRERYDRGRAEQERGRGNYARPQFQPREAQRPAFAGRPPAPSAPPPGRGRPSDEGSRRTLNAAPSLLDTNGSR